MAERPGAVLDVHAAFGRGRAGWEHPDAPGSLTGEAIWLAWLIVALLPGEPEGLLALMLSCTARRIARCYSSGRFAPSGRAF